VSTRIASLCTDFRLSTPMALLALALVAHRKIDADGVPLSRA
jgi:hypothetical protein